MGVVFTIEEALRTLGLDPTSMTAVVQGFGNVGSFAAEFLKNLGVKVVGVNDRFAGFHCPAGLDIDGMVGYLTEHGSLKGYSHPDADTVTSEELLALPCDILVPAALGGVVHRDNVHTIKARIIAEGANSPITPLANDALRERGVVILPDILANAGGVTVSYLEWVQDIQNLSWDLDQVRTMLRRTMVQGFRTVWDASVEHKVDLRTAAMMVGVGRVADAMKTRGLYP